MGTRTWVSGLGDDANPGSRTAPCKTFAGAISKTIEPGEINVTDPGGFGAVTITKAITIDGAGTFASILAGERGRDHQCQSRRRRDAAEPVHQRVGDRARRDPFSGGSGACTSKTA